MQAGGESSQFSGVFCALIRSLGFDKRSMADGPASLRHGQDYWAGVSDDGRAVCERLDYDSGEGEVLVSE